MLHANEQGGAEEYCLESNDCSAFQGIADHVHLRQEPQQVILNISVNIWNIEKLGKR